LRAVKFNAPITVHSAAHFHYPDRTVVARFTLTITKVTKILMMLYGFVFLVIKPRILPPPVRRTVTAFILRKK